MRVKAQIDTLDTQVEIAAERFNEAGVKLAKINKNLRKNQARLQQLQKRLNRLQGRLGTRAQNMYRGGSLGFLEVLAGSTSFDEFANNWELMTQMSQDDAGMIGDNKDTRAAVASTRKNLKAQQDAAAAQLKIRRQQRRYVEGKLAARQKLYASVKSEIKRLEAEEARQAALAAAAAARNHSFSGGGDGGNWPAPSIPAHAGVVEIARSRLGAPYVWAASGPNSFDCSGLTSWAYAQIGISIPRTSREQINCGQRVSRSDIQPGDLVFFGSPIHHVGMYVGGGMMIHAPHSGDVVKIDPAFRSNYVGACRPG